MADVWRVYDGREPTRGQPWVSLPVDQAIALLELEPRHFISDQSRTPRFGSQERDLSIFGYKHVVVEMHPDEIRNPNWKAGFYRSPIPPSRAFGLMLHHALVPVLGDANVLRVEYSSYSDSVGRDTVRVLVVLKPDALRHVTGEANVKAVVRLRELLSEMGIEGSPMLQYATEAELAQHDQ